jgi:hypothetical protein
MLLAGVEQFIPYQQSGLFWIAGGSWCLMSLKYVMINKNQTLLKQLLQTGMSSSRGIVIGADSC